LSFGAGAETATAATISVATTHDRISSSISKGRCDGYERLAAVS